MTSAFIASCAGTELSPDEIAFFRDAEPWGFILFKRNCDNPDQIRALTAALRESVGRDAPILIDQEGGRVQRLGPPHWPAYPSAGALGRLHARDADRGIETTRVGARLIAHDLKSLGIDVDCIPCLDLPVLGAHDIIGERAYGRSPEIVVPMARAATEGLMAGGVLPVMKHMPGHGRATVDSHHDLPRIAEDLVTLEEHDFRPFAALADLPMAMTAHIVFEAIDPLHPATASPDVIAQVIRGRLGFDGVLMSDDLSMKALGGTFEERTRASLDAGCDLVLYCHGVMEEMVAVASASRPLEGDALRRTDAALGLRRPADEIDIAAAKARFLELLAARN